MRALSTFAVPGVSALIVLAVGTALVILLRPPERTSSSLLRPDDSRVVALGQDLYAQRCATCHGANLEGQEASTPGKAAPPHDGSGHTWRHPDHVLFELTKFGASGVICLTTNDSNMPTFEDSLKDEEIYAVLSFIKSRWPAKIRQRHDEINAIYATSVK